MQTALFIPERYESRYSLLGAFCREVGEAARELGVSVNPEGGEVVESIRAGKTAPVFVMFNMPGGAGTLSAWMNAQAGVAERGVLVQWMVDHPLNADAKLLAQLSPQGGYRFACVADDDLHLLQMRWNGIRRMRLWHGVARSALCDVESIERGERDVDVLLAGSIASEAEIAAMRGAMPTVLHAGCDEIVRLRLAHPAMSFGQAFDIAMPVGLHCDDMWGLMAVVFRYTTARVNRERRLGVLKALKGLNVTVLGGEAWREHVGGAEAAGARLVGEVKYEELASWAARSKVWVGVNPSQFVHAFSERLLVGMAGGAACVSDDREWVRREFEGACARFDVRDGDGLRGRVEELLRDAGRRAEVAINGRRTVEAKHLWMHRVRELLGLLGVGK